MEPKTPRKIKLFQSITKSAHDAAQNSLNSESPRNQLPVAKKHRSSSASLDAPDGFEAGARMDFRLRQHRGLGAEAFDQRAHIRPDRRRRHQHRRLAFACGALET